MPAPNLIGPEPRSTPSSPRSSVGTFRAVFDGVGVFAVIAKHLNETLVRPSERAGVELPAALERLVLACLAKAPADRPANAALLGGALAAIDLEPWTQDDAARWWTAIQTG